MIFIKNVADTIGIVISFLSVDETLKFRRVNSLWNHAISSSHSYWRSFHCELFKYLSCAPNCEFDEDLNWLKQVFSKIPTPMKSMSGNSGQLFDIPFDSNGIYSSANWKSKFYQNQPKEELCCSDSVEVFEIEACYFKFQHPIPEEGLKAAYCV